MSQEKYSPFLKKRNSLQQFVKEQLVGPGGFNKKYYLLSNWKNHEFNGKRIVSCSAGANFSEVIPEVPAYHYSSAILFPQVSLQSLTSPEEADAIDQKNDENEPIKEAGQDEFSGEQAESISSRNQNYPNTLGLSIAIEPGINISNSLDVEISLRSYQKIKQQELSPLMLGHWIQFHEVEVTNLIRKYMGDIFRVLERDGNYFVLANEQVDLNDHLYTIDYVYLEKIRVSEILPLIALLYTESKFFVYTSSPYAGVEYNYHLIFEESLLDQLKADLISESTKTEQILELLTLIEQYNQVKSITTELKTVYRKPSFKNRPTPIWAAKSHHFKLTLPDPQIRTGTSRGKLPVSQELGLQLNYQYLFHHKGLLYIKLILSNNNILNLGQDEPPQLNKKDRANELSYFGVELKVTEKCSDILRPYNPPNQISIDQEDNFNKILYRDYNDYGEGYNTSVTWEYEEQNKLRQVRTEFLPYEDTPDVDFEPTKIEGEKLTNLIDKQALSMRSLSTLSTKSDQDLRKLLDDFTDAYGTWITTQSEELALEDNLNDASRTVLLKQLNGCQRDFKRLKRNIGLLFTNSKALAAFKVMNTAMYMQLEHGKGIKSLDEGSLKTYTPNQNSPSYYQKCENEYQWRSFQLAFILLNLDAFVQPAADDQTVPDVFGTGWPERNEIADLVWFPTGGGKTEAYLGIIGFCIAYRRFTKESPSRGGTAVLMRYTLRLLTLQQFQRATLLICALEVIRKGNYPMPNGYGLGEERITIGLFVGGGSLPNTWADMDLELKKIADQLRQSPELNRPRTKLPITECPWCGGALFTKPNLLNLSHRSGDTYKPADKFSIVCNTPQCVFYGAWANGEKSLPIRIFDEDIYKDPPTLLFGTVDKFAALANNVDTAPSGRIKDSQRFFGKGDKQGHFPPELIIQDELHLLLGPLGSAVGLFEKAVDECCTERYAGGITIRPKVITSTATTRNTDKQIFALFNRRAEIFPKQGIRSSDSFFASYKRDPKEPKAPVSKRRYMGVLPVGKTQVWMQLRLASIALAHRVKYMIEEIGSRVVLENHENYQSQSQVLDYYHTVLSYFNSLKEVGKTQSQLTHYLPSDLDLVLGNAIGWTILGKFIRPSQDIQEGELTGRLSGEEVKGNLAKIQRKWNFLGKTQPPELVISTNMISVGIDVSRFNTMIINSMPRNIAEYIQASSRVAREREGIVFTVHHPFRSRDLSHYQRFKEFHEKFYSYVEPISVTPFADKALERYFAMFLAVMVRHNKNLPFQNNKDAARLSRVDVTQIKKEIMAYITEIYTNGSRLSDFMQSRDYGVAITISGILDKGEVEEISNKLDELLIDRWLERLDGQEFRYRHENEALSLFSREGISSPYRHWNVKYSLREIAPTIVIKTVQQ